MGFLYNRDIHDVVGIQELLHFVKLDHKRDFISKIDLSKAFDKVNWTYLRLLLIWICVLIMYNTRSYGGRW